MEQLRKLVLANNFGSAKLRKQANGMLRKCLATSGEACIREVVEWLFGCEANCCEPEFLGLAFETVLKSECGGRFVEMAKEAVDKSFWVAEKPAICALVNLCQIPGDVDVFGGKECEFVFILVKFVFEFPVECFEYLGIVVGKFVEHLKRCDVQLPEELVQQVDDAFDMKTVQTVLATYLVKTGERELALDAMDAVFGAAVGCLASFYDTKQLAEMRVATVPLFAISLKGERFLLLQSHFVKAIGSENLKAKLLEKCVEMLKGSAEPDVLSFLYKAFGNVLGVGDCQILVHFMKRDFETSSDGVRLVLQENFAKICGLDRRGITDVCTPVVTAIPWHSKMKRFMFPYLFAEGNSRLLKDLIELAQDPQSRSFVAKCISAVSDIKFILDGIAEPRTEIVTLEPLFAPNCEIPRACLEHLPTENLQRISLLLDAVVSFPRHFSSKITIDDLETAMSSLNVSLRVRGFTAYVAAGYPKNEHDCGVFCRCLDSSLLMIDSVAEQGMIPKLFEHMISSIMAHEKKKDNLPMQDFMSDLLSICCKRLVPTTNDIQRQMCLSMCSSIWKRFPDVGKKEDLSKFNTTLVHAQAGLKKIALDVANLTGKAEVQIPNQKSELVEVPGPETPFDDLRNFRILVEKNGMKGSDEIVSNVIKRAESYQENDWETKSELYLILCSMTCSVEASSAIATSLFNALMKTRKAGFIGGCYLALKKVLQRIKSKEEQILGFAKEFISSFSEFDMAQMRRSAGLPFISVALMGSTDKVLNVVLDGLLSLGETTTNEQEETNVINTLKPTVREHKLDLAVLARIFSLLFDACYRFSSSWDVKSAVDLVYVTLLLKIWEILATETVLRTLSMYRFFHEISGSRNVVKKALTSGNSHAIYLALLLLRHFPADAGDQELADLVEKVGDSPSSRIRRTAARAFAAVVSIDNRESVAIRIVDALPNDTNNQLHFHLLVLNELQVPVSVSVDTRNCPMLKEALHKLQGTTPDWTKQRLGSLVTMLRTWAPDTPVPQDLTNHLVSRLITPELLNGNEAFQIEGVRFLALHLTPNSLTQAQGLTIIDLIKRTGSVELQAALIRLLRFVQDADVSGLIDFAFEYASNPFEAFVPVQMSLSFIADLLHSREGGSSVIFFLLLNDIPKVRRQTADMIGMTNQSEILSVTELVRNMSDAIRRKVVSQWIRVVESRVDESEPMTFYVDEFKIFYVLVPESEAEFWRTIEHPLSIQEMRRKMLSLLRQMGF